MSDEHIQTLVQEQGDGTITLAHKIVTGLDAVLKAPTERAGQLPSIHHRLKKPGVPQLPDLEGLSSVAMWWDRCASRFI